MRIETGAYKGFGLHMWPLYARKRDNHVLGKPHPYEHTPNDHFNY